MNWYKSAQAVIVDRDGDKYLVSCPKCKKYDTLNRTGKSVLPKDTEFKETGFADTDYVRTVIECDCGCEFGVYTEDGMNEAYLDRTDKNMDGHEHATYLISDDDMILTPTQYAKKQIKGMGLKEGDKVEVSPWHGDNFTGKIVGFEKAKVKIQKDGEEPDEDGYVPSFEPTELSKL